MAYIPSGNWTLGARGAQAFNSRNKDNQIKSGDYGALDLAVAYRSPIGVFGPHILKVRQYADDRDAIDVWCRCVASQRGRQARRRLRESKGSS